MIEDQDAVGGIGHRQQHIALVAEVDQDDLTPAHLRRRLLVDARVELEARRRMGLVDDPGAREAIQAIGVVDAERMPVRRWLLVQDSKAPPRVGRLQPQRVSSLPQIWPSQPRVGVAHRPAGLVLRDARAPLNPAPAAFVRALGSRITGLALLLLALGLMGFS
ncbi:hypothetical protein [Halochromatium sp.]|uniref:hypothetical protein n=1 Tax=Halochromatium sp. TaxID=2049430 RepID=UPI003979210F